MLHKVDLKFKSSACIIHDVGVTENYNIILDYPQKFGIERPILGKRFIEFDRDAKSRIGVMPRFGDEESILWFNVKNHCTYHLINCFEDDDKVIVRGCKLLDTIITTPDDKIERSEWYRRAYIQHDESSQDYDPSKDGVLFSRPYEWRLNLKTHRVEEGYLIENGVAMDFPVINNQFTGIKNKYSYTQVADSIASSTIGMFKYKMFAKLYFDEHDEEINGNIKVEYHVMDDNHFCSGIEFVKKQDAIDEDDGWVVCYVHDENKNQSKVYIIDAKNFSKEPVAKLKLPQRVPYGYHGIYLYK
ncbi:carotenoid 9,10(9',10')-cleavage dioxygenase 1-like [Dioscorea cayenensis subsp. rotundata]|uniref:Carotenoid 9,10(9',10')-cleavage dioxygenase 1-like n=1 Tax=Dioscorea cayennensis subsp. rotundata TaxID=55577 RepID=A0AB40CUW7_DIOCR|nr:carotenoid 9,10(9',10')-cleavage dioxygenase 1-like [Dioscorea cayenensis subsp. rotundata]XP_039142978.1 carotenoid 9,10(9',10')-cleavage dioxygenase 1-like [Dioscorea cayenensis subsp. rotundata]XP_039142979.1 carotenoid 9,10(9',10')-cleavage dioxygenase 1-like [Dioscorea cayenensis subsp. rotundata]